MKRLLTSHRLITALFAALFTLILHNGSNAQTVIHVDAVNGINAATGRGSAANPYKSITFALLISERNNLPDPWHVHIQPGNYNGDAAKGNAREIFPLKLRREMIFEGTTTAAECIIDGQHTGAATVPILQGEDTEGVTIRNLTVQNSLRTDGVGGIVLHDPTGTKETPSKLEGCIVHNNKGGGVWSNMPLILTGNTFSNNDGNGVWNSKSTAAMDNTFRTNSEGGLHIQGNSTGDISENVFQDNQYGLYAHTLEATVTKNTFTGHNRRGGFWVRAFIGDVTYNTFTGNVGSARGSGGGFQAGGFTGNVAYNTFENNSTGERSGGGGFLIGGHDRNNSNFSRGTTNFVGDIIHNVFTENTGRDAGGGFFILGSFTGNVAHNTFTGNISTDPGAGGGGFNVGRTFTGNIDHNDFTRNTTVGDWSNIGGGFVISKLVGNITHNIFDSNSSGSAGAFELLESTDTVEVFNNIFFNNTSTGTGNAIVTRHATHFMNNLFMISDELSEGVSGVHTVWLNSPECRFHNNIFTGVKTAIYTDGTFDLHITHNLFHNVKIDFVEQAGNNLGNELLFWELVAVNATDNLEGDPRLVDPVTTRDFHLQSTSPAIDAGTNAFAPEDDLEGAARPVGATVDIGPYEYGGTPVPGTSGATVQDTPKDEPTVVEVPTIPDKPTSEPVEELPPPEPTLKLYWATREKIQRGDLDGSNIEDVLNQAAEHIALDAVNGKLYWTHADNGIFRANLADGTNIEQIVDEDIWSISGGGIALDIAGGKMYWTNGETNSLFGANLDGTNAEELLKVGNDGSPVDIALDISGGKMYWTQWGTEVSIFRANLDGANVEPLIKASEIRDVALDVSGGKMYWTNGFEGIGMANLDGTNATSFDTPNYIMGGLTLNLSHGTLYWIDGEGSEIRRGNLDGSQQQAILKAQISDIALSVSVVEPVAPAKMYPAWDVNADGKTDIADLVIVATALGSSAPENPRADVNGDGTVNIQDLIQVATHLGEVAGPASPVIVALPKHFTPDTLQQVLDLLRAQSDGSLAFQRAITNVEQLLARLLPKETALLANYPNPFNPETWIPYQLAEPANVTLHIHAVDGTLVRTLSLGHKPIGIYQTRTHAAYWDGRNQIGEPVASGVYFYTFTAGDFTATRKMLIRK